MPPKLSKNFHGVGIGPLSKILAVKLFQRFYALLLINNLEQFAAQVKLRYLSYIFRKNELESNQFQNYHFGLLISMPRITDDMIVLDPETGEFTFEIKHSRNQDQEPESLSKVHRVSPNRTQFPKSLSKVTVRTLALKCTLCKNKPIIMKSENELNLHFKDIHQDIRFCCYLCSSIFADLTVLFTHIQRIHSEQNPNVESVALFSEMTMSRIGYLAGNQNRCAADKVLV